ncbi:LmbU family transcriptional regulator [Sciscionella sediminilitoris]|uniref:LmbU family transcriptional regulator n=1 Tax=Sciscionella sediminilitoris TaxID=1445613 RepID=UPI001E4D65C5|nr:LmbU family transcriptional regulator [Sciscionella sp. SE31]
MAKLGRMESERNTRTKTATGTRLPEQRSKRTRLLSNDNVLTKRVSLQIREGIPIRDWRDLGQHIHILTDSSSWWLGDWLLYGQHQYPRRYQEAVEQTSLDYQTLRNYAWVARRFPPSRRHAKLSFQHHAEVAPLSDAEQDNWLTIAEKRNWSRNELRRRIREQREAFSEPREVTNGHSVVQLTMNIADEKKQRWQQAADKAEQDLLSWILSVLDNAAGPEN